MPFQDTEAESSELAAAKANLERQIGSLSTQLTKAHEAQEEVLRRNGDQEAKMQERIGEMDAEIVRLTSEFMSLRAEVDAESTQRATLEDECETLRAELGFLELQLDQVRGSWSDSGGGDDGCGVCRHCG